MSLRKELRQRLTLIKQEIGEGVFEKDQLSEDPAFITQATCEAVCAELNMCYDPKTRTILQNINSDLGDTPFDRGLGMAQGYLQYFLDDKGYNTSGANGILYQIGVWLEKCFGHNNTKTTGSFIMKNSASVGIAIVINAFHRQLGPEFLDRLKAAHPGQLMKAFDEVNATFPNQLAIIERVKNPNSMPASQIFLSPLVTQLSKESPFHPVVEYGAMAMYHIINKLWPSLKTPPPTPEK